jgi:hypothetical protein
MREAQPLNPRAVAAWVGGSIAALALLVALAEPVLFLYYLALAILLGACSLLVVAISRGHEIDELKAEIERRDREAVAFMASQINPATATALPLGDTPPAGLSDRMVEGTRARLRVVEQRNPTHDIYDHGGQL